MSALGDRLAVLGGADLDLLKQAPSQRSAFVQMACVLLSTSSIAALSMYFALSTAVGVHHIPAVLLALFWGLVILNIDRFLTTSMNATRGLPRLLGMAVPRVLLAAVIGLVVSTPLVLQVFRSDIAFNLTQTNTAVSEANKGAIAGSDEQKRVNDLTAKVADLEKQLEDGKITVSSPQLSAAEAKVVDLKKQVARQQKIADEAQRLYICERYGTGRNRLKDPSKCSPKPGLNGPYKQIEADYRQQQNILTTLKTSLANAQDDRDRVYSKATSAAGEERQRAVPQIQTDLAKTKKDLAIAQAALDASRDRLQSTTASNTGLLAQIKALFHDEDPTLKFTHFMVATLFFLIELLPVLVKVIRSLSGPNLYETVAANVEERGKTELALYTVAASTVAKEKADNLIKAEADLREHELRLAKHANTVVAERMRELVEGALEDWAVQSKATLSSAAADDDMRAASYRRVAASRLRRVFFPDRSDL